MNLAHFRQRIAADNNSISKIRVLSYVGTHRVHMWQTPLCSKTAVRIVPFLSHFKNLQHVFIGGIGSIGTLVGVARTFSYGPYLVPAESKAFVKNLVAIHLGMIQSLCQGFEMGALPSLLRIGGLESKCLHWKHDGAQECPVCSSILKSFSFSHIFQFYGQDHSCFTTPELLNAILQRRGGREFLQDPVRFTVPLARAIGGARIDKIAFAGEGKLRLIRMLIDQGCNPASMRQEDLFRSIFTDSIRSIYTHKDSNMPLPPRDERYIIKTYFDALVVFKFPISEEECVVIPHGVFW